MEVELSTIEEAVALLDEWIEEARRAQAHANYWHFAYLAEKEARQRELDCQF